MDIGITLNSLHNEESVKREYSTSIEENPQQVIIQTTEFNESLTLLYNLQHEMPDIIIFLQATGFISYNNKNSYIEKIIISIWYFISRIFVLYGIAISVFVSLEYIMYLGDSSIRIYPPIFYGCYLMFSTAMFFQFCIAISSYYMFTLRLKKKYNPIEFGHFKSTLKRCWQLYFISVVITCIPIIIYLSLQLETIIVPLVLSEYVISGVLAVNSLFIIVDSKVCVSLINELQIVVLKNEITIKSYCLARNEINKRVENSRMLNNALVVVAAMNMIGMISVMIASIEFTHEALSTSFLCLKEVLILIVIFYETSQVNEKSDELTNSLCNFENQFLQLERFGTALQASNQPIGFPILNKRYKRWDVILQLGGLLTTIIILLLKNIFNQLL